MVSYNIRDKIMALISDLLGQNWPKLLIADVEFGYKADGIGH